LKSLSVPKVKGFVSFLQQASYIFLKKIHRCFQGTRNGLFFALDKFRKIKRMHNLVLKHPILKPAFQT